MTTIALTISDELSAQLEPYREQLAELLRLGLREVRLEQSLALFRKGGVSLWKAARLAGVSLRKMTQYAVSQGLRATLNDEMIQEELA
jgi:predicted HTH domain antitoxin